MMLVNVKQPIIKAQGTRFEFKKIQRYHIDSTHEQRGFVY